jgi:hypothetical protein
MQLGMKVVRRLLLIRRIGGGEGGPGERCREVMYYLVRERVRAFYRWLLAAGHLVLTQDGLAGMYVRVWTCGPNVLRWSIR